MFAAPARKAALEALDTIEELFGAGCEKAVACLRDNQ